MIIFFFFKKKAPEDGLFDLPRQFLGSLHREFTVSAEQAVPQLNVLGVVAIGQGVVASVETGVENTDIDVNAGVPEGSDEHNWPHGNADGNNVDGVSGEEPEAGDGASGNAGVEEISRVSVGGVEPASAGVGFPVVMLVDKTVDGGEFVNKSVASVIHEVGQGEHEDEGDGSVEKTHLVHVPNNSLGVPDNADDDERDEREDNKTVEINVGIVGES
jgi:hypothetical protein